MGPEYVEIESQPLGIGQDRADRQIVLMRQESIVHLPEAFLSRRRLGGLGSKLRLGVHVA